MNVLIKIAIILGAIVVLFILMPRQGTVLLFSQQSAGRTIRLGPGQAVQQRVWLPGDAASSIELSFMQKKAAPLPVQLRLLADSDTHPHQELVSSSRVTSALATNPQTATLLLPAAVRSHISERWVWVELQNNSTSDALFVFREIDSTVYPSGRVVLQPTNQDQPGVLAFNVYGTQLRWISPAKGLLILIVLLVLWILVPWERLESARLN